MKIFPIFIPFLGCPLRCIYCQQGFITNQKDISEREIKIDNLIEQLDTFCRKYKKEDIEIAFYGGSFTLLDFQIQAKLLKGIEKYSKYTSGIRVSTRPDGINMNVLRFCQSHNIKTIELGIQSFSDQVLAANKRIYGSERAIESCNMIKRNKIKLGIQLMPGLFKSNRQTLAETVSKTIAIKPDYVRIYPTIVLRDTELASYYEEGIYQPLKLEQAIDICADMKIEFDKHNIKVIKTGLHSDLSLTEEAVVAGPYHPSFGELVVIEVYYRSVKDKLKLYEIEQEKSPENNPFTLVISDKAVSLFWGHNRQLLHKIKAIWGTSTLPVIVDKELSLKEFRLTKQHPANTW